jgi:hypothetical protein
VAHRVRRLQIREVGDRLERRVELLVGEVLAQARLRLDHRVPARGRQQRREQLACPIAEALNHGRVELRAAALARDRHRSIDPALAVKHLDHVGELHDPHRRADRLAREPPGVSSAIPAFEHLAKRVAHRLAQPEASCQISRDHAVRATHRLDRAAACDEELERGPRPPRRRVTGADVSHDEPRLFDPDQIGGVVVRARGDVIAEPPGLLERVRTAAHPRQQGNVVHDRAIGLAQPEALAQPQCEHAHPQHVLHRLTQPQVGTQRQRGDQLGNTDTRVPIPGNHGQSLQTLSGAQRQGPHVSAVRHHVVKPGRRRPPAAPLAAGLRGPHGQIREAEAVDRRMGGLSRDVQSGPRP